MTDQPTPDAATPDPAILGQLETALAEMLEVAQADDPDRVRQMAGDISEMTRQASRLPLPLSDEQFDQVGRIRLLTQQVDLAMAANCQQVKQELRDSSHSRRTLRAYHDSSGS